MHIHVCCTVHVAMYSECVSKNVVSVMLENEILCSIQSIIASEIIYGRPMECYNKNAAHPKNQESRIASE